ncbi:MAG: MFS transporter, partial [Bryobacteraceae bacterium]
ELPRYPTRLLFSNRQSSYKWLVVFMLWFVCLLNYADRQAIYSVFPVLKRQYGLTNLQLSYIASSFMWVYAIAGPFGGLIADRVSRKFIILSGLIFWSAVTIFTALSQNYWQLVLCRALEGLGEACYFPASMSMLSAYHPPETRSRAIAWHQSSIYVGTIAGGSVAGLLAEQYGWRSSFYLFGSAGIVLGCVLLFFLEEPAPPSDPAERRPYSIPATIRRLFGAPMPVILMLVFIGANFVNVVFLTWLPYYLNQFFHMSLGLSGWNATAYLQAGSILGVVLGGILADLWIRSRKAGRMLVQAAGLLAGTPFLFMTGWTRAVPLFLLSLAAFGLCRGLYDSNLSAALHDVVPVQLRGTAVGVLNSLGWLGAGVGPLAMAAASSRIGMSACLSANSAIYGFIGILLVFSAIRFVPERQRQSLVVS